MMHLRALGKMKQWLRQENQERRGARRLTEPEMVVYSWDGSAPKGRHVRDVSQSGAYIYTPERWYVGTLMRLVLQGYRTAVREDGSAASMPSTCIPGRVVRHGVDGVAVEFVFCDKKEKETFRTFLTGIPVHTPSQSAPSDDATIRTEGKLPGATHETLPEEFGPHSRLRAGLFCSPRA
jgi:hypothetical protein